MERCGCNLPTNGQIATKAKKLEQARKHVITDTEIEKMVREKEKYRSAPVNFATKKTTLIKLRDAAETEGNIDQVDIRNKVGCVLPMVIWSEFRLWQYRDDDHGEYASHFRIST